MHKNALHHTALSTMDPDIKPLDNCYELSYTWVVHDVRTTLHGRRFNVFIPIRFHFVLTSYASWVRNSIKKIFFALLKERFDGFIGYLVELFKN